MRHSSMGISTPFFQGFGPLLFGRKPWKTLRGLRGVGSREAAGRSAERDQQPGAFASTTGDILGFCVAGDAAAEFVPGGGSQGRGLVAMAAERSFRQESAQCECLLPISCPFGILRLMARKAQLRSISIQLIIRNAPTVMTGPTPSGSPIPKIREDLFRFLRIRRFPV